jgi:hypothetical protein
VDWAREHDAGTAVVAELEAGGPAAAKEWAKKQGLDPVAFLGDEAPAAVAAAPAPSPDGGVDDDAPTVVRAVAAGGGGVGMGRGAGGRGAGASRAAGVGGAAAAAAAPIPQRVPRRRWETPEVVRQVEALQGDQGTHRDERSLLGGEVEKVTTASGGTNETLRVQLSNGMVGYHKSFDGLNDSIARAFGQTSAQQCVHEVAAWQLARGLGGPWDEIVPPAVVREVNGKLGSFALERPGKPGARLDVKVSPEWRSAAFFDSLIGQQDRHGLNYLVAGDRVTLIDHGYAFARPGDYKNHSSLVSARRREKDAKLSYDERDALNRLLASKDLFGLERSLEPARAQALRARAQRMLATGSILSAGDY